MQYWVQCQYQCSVKYNSNINAMLGTMAMSIQYKVQLQCQCIIKYNSDGNAILSTTTMTMLMQY